MAKKSIVFGAVLVTLMGAAALATTINQDCGPAIGKNSKDPIYRKFRQAMGATIGPKTDLGQIMQAEQVSLIIPKCAIATTTNDNGDMTRELEVQLQRAKVQSSDHLPGVETITIYGDDSQGDINGQFSAKVSRLLSRDNNS